MPLAKGPVDAGQKVAKMAWDWLLEPVFESSRRVMHDIGTAIGTNKDAPEADIWDLINVATAISPVAAKPAATAGRKAVGRLVTNTVEPFGYNLSPSTLDAKKLIRHHPGEAFKRLAKDEPLFSNIAGSARAEARKAREFPFRKMFGLEPRSGQQRFRKIGEDTYALTDFSSEGHMSFRREVQRDIEESLSDAVTYGKEADLSWSGGHSVMGGYDVKYLGKTKGGHLKFEYSDTWDFAMNPGERQDFLNRIVRKVDKYNELALQLKGGSYAAGMRRTEAATVWVAREIASALTKPITVKGRIVIDPQRVAFHVPGKGRMLSEKQLEFLKSIQETAVSTR